MKSFTLVRFAPYLLLLVFGGCTKSAPVQTPVQTTTSTTPVVTTTQTVVKETDVIKDLTKPVTLDDRFSYTYGYMLYTSLQQQGFGDLDAEYFAKGALDAAKQMGFFSHDEMALTLQEVQTRLLKIAQEEREALAAKNLENAKAFLGTNAKREHVQTTDSGLQFEVLAPGTGDPPTDESYVEVHYRLMLPDGRLLDSSYDRGRTSTFYLKDIKVPGFVEAVKLMNVGSKYRFWISPELAYGKEGTQKIDPNSMLIVEIELKAINQSL